LVVTKSFDESFAKVLLVGLLLAIVSGAVAQKQQWTTATPDVRLFPLAGSASWHERYARTVFSGTEPQEFSVEILAFCQAFRTRQSAIIARLSGSANVEKDRVFAGMSGSPVYIDNKLVGAIAFSFPFPKSQSPASRRFKQMIDLFEKGTADCYKGPKEPRGFFCSVSGYGLET